MKNKLYLLILGLFLINFISATSVGTSDLTEGKVVFISPDVPINYSTIATVNSSDFWDDFDTPADIDVESFSTSLTSGSILFSDGSNIAQDNSNLFWDNVNKRLETSEIKISKGVGYDITISQDGASDRSNNLILTDDTNTWWLRHSGNDFQIRDVTNNVVPFEIDDNAPDGAFIIRAITGNVIIPNLVMIGSSAAPDVTLHLKMTGVDTVTLRTENIEHLETGEFMGNRMTGENSGGTKLHVDTFFEPNTGKYGWGFGTTAANLPITAGIGFADIVIDGGNVGIGVTDPDERLAIAGNIFLQNDSDKIYFGEAKDFSITMNGSHNLFTNEVGSAPFSFMGGDFGIGIVPDSIFHIKANTPGTVGSHAAGQLIIQDPDDTVFGNVVITAYESDGAGNPDQQLWYLGSSSGSNTDITFLNRRNANLHLGTNGVSRLTILGNGNVEIFANLTVDTLFAKAINISNSSFSFTHDENNSISFSIQNKNNGSNATSLITAVNDVGGFFGIGIASSSYLLGSMLKPNITAVFSKSRGEMNFINFFKQTFVWYNNPSDDGDANNLVEIMKLDESGLNVTGNITAGNIFTPQYLFAHNNATMVLASANVWANLTFTQEEAEIRKGISHTYNDGTNHTFTILESGVYDINFNFDVIDTSASSTDIDVVGRVVFSNGTEIDGSVFETDITKKNIETEISHTLLAKLTGGDIIVFQFVAADVDVQVSTHGSFGSHPESSTITINKIANL